MKYLAHDLHARILEVAMAHKAYGVVHQRRRKSLLLAHEDHHTRTGIWLPCPRCGAAMIPDPLLPGLGLDLGHSQAWMKAQGLPGDQLEHSNCNRSAGDGSRAEWSSVQW